MLIKKKNPKRYKAHTQSQPVKESELLVEFPNGS